MSIDELHNQADSDQVEPEIELNGPTTVSASKPYLHLFIIAIVYAFISSVGISLLHKYLFSLPLIVVFLGATFSLVGLWSVLGPGKFFFRLICALGFGSVVLMSCAVTSRYSKYWGAPSQDFSLSLCLLIGLISGFVLSVAAQIPFWFFRFFSGHRISKAGKTQNHSISLKEFFAITFVFGLTFAAPAIVDHQLLAHELNHIELGQTTIQWDEERQPDGSINGVEVEVTSENIDELKANARTISKQGFFQQSILACSGWVALLSLLSLPLAYFAFHPTRGYKHVLLAAFFYCTVFAMLGSVSLISIAQNPIDWGEQIEIVALIILQIFAITIPLIASVLPGLHLLSPNQNPDSFASSRFAHSFLPELGLANQTE